MQFIKTNLKLISEKKKMNYVIYKNLKHLSSSVLISISLNFKHYSYELLDIFHYLTLISCKFMHELCLYVDLFKNE